MRSTRSLQHFMTGAGSTAVTLILGFIATPWLIAWVGTECFGAYRTVLDWIGYLAILELGIGEALLPLATEAVAVSDTRLRNEKSRKVLVVGIRAYGFVVVAKMLVGTILVIGLPRLVPVSSGLGHDLLVAGAIGVAGHLLSPVQPLRILLESRQLGYRVNLFLLMQSVCTTILALLFGRLGFGISGQLLAILLGSIPYHLSLLFYQQREFPGLWREALVGSPDSTLWRSLWHLNRPQFLANICGRVSLMSNNIIVAYFLGASHVSAFYVTQRLMSVVQSQLYAIGNATWAPLRDISLQGDHELFQKRLFELSRLITVIGLVILAPIVAFNQTFIILWVGQAQYSGYAVGALAAMNAILLALIALWSWNFSVSGKVQAVLPQYLAFAVANFGASLIFTKFLGSYGPLLGTFVATVGISFWAVPREMERHFKVPATRLIGSVLRPLATLSPAVLALQFLAMKVEFLSWLGYAAVLIVSSMLLAILAWLFVFSSDEREQWQARFLGWFRQFTAR